MTIRVDHVFIGSAAGALESEVLIDAGVTESSPNVHQGQGTSNRRLLCKPLCAAVETGRLS